MAPRGWRRVTDRGLRLACPDPLALAEAIAACRLPEVVDIQPADGSLLVVLRPGSPVPAVLRTMDVAVVLPTRDSATRVVEIPVHYGGADGPDLAHLAEQAGMGVAEAARRHMDAEYRVMFMGFLPGFPYLAGTPAELALPRRVMPRLRVAAGSVAIGAGYTGIYPSPSPGGWWLIGRTEQTLFDPARAPVCLLAPGDRVRFVSPSSLAQA